MTDSDSILNLLYSAKTSDDCVSSGLELGLFVKREGLRVLHLNILSSLHDAASDKKSGFRREAAFWGFSGILSNATGAIIPYILPFLGVLFLGTADKGQVVRDAANSALDAFFRLVSKESFVPHLLSPILDALESSKHFQKLSALKTLSSLSKSSPDQVSQALVSLIPAVSACIDDTHPDVSKSAYSTMTDICSTVPNQDLTPKISILVSCIAHPTEITQCIQKLSATTFVAEVTGPSLAILVPILVRALNERSMTVQRQTVIIIDNLCKLVRDPAEAGQFLPLLLPGLDRILEVAAFPEVRALATAARNTLVKAGGGQATVQQIPTELNIPSITSKLESLILNLTGTFVDSFLMQSLDFIAPLISNMALGNRLVYKEWIELDICTSIFLSFLTPKECETVTRSILKYYQDLDRKRRQGDVIEDDDGVEEVCNCDFSLAYGGMMLLNHTNLTLKRGKRYGLCGANGAGKSTLMRAIANGKLEGFPPPSELKTIMVEHALQGEDASLSLVDFIASDERLLGVTKADIENALNEVGFTTQMRQDAVGSLSGGWKMKLELARAMLMNADILLLDEPTNHLDVGNVKWLEDYLNSQTRVTSLIVSHDSGFLDNVCTSIIHYEKKKLVFYKGNLSEYQMPEAKSYYTLTASQVKFAFPPPTILTGVKSNTKAILYMNGCTYQYPGASKKSLEDVSVQVSLSSRVGIIGKNGAGKSTLIKVLLGEVQPQQGVVWKHPNLRIGYVAQHAFHHLDQHLDLTPNKYLQWRYANGDDREVLEKVTRVLTEEDIAQMNTEFNINGEIRKIEYILGRQKLKKSFQYEIKWVGKKHKFNSWLPRETLLEKGFQKIVQEFDDHEAAREGLGYRELVPSVIRKHFEDVGLDGDIADYNQIGGLSGGQKVKVVIAAALWQNPHILVLDEPTNFLDRDSLGGLAVAIRDWGGGVIMISHNDEFISALCPEMWHVEAGKLTHKGKKALATDNFEDHAEEAKKIEAKIRPKKKKLTRNQIKEREVRRRERHLKWLIEGGDKPQDTDSD